jgi:hypothetical protein
MSTSADPGSVTATVTGDESFDTGLGAAFAEGNRTTKADLFSRAKDAIEAGDQSLHDAAEALALAQEDFNASQREIADAVGKSVAWVNRLLQWRRQGFVGTPFGPGSKARRERCDAMHGTALTGGRVLHLENDRMNRGALKMSMEICWRRATGRALVVFSRPHRRITP